MNPESNMTAIPSESQNITREKLKKFLPKGSSVQVTDEILETIWNMERDINLPQNLLEEDVMSYLYLIGKVSGVGLSDLVNAIKYCNLKRNRSNKDAWAIIFPKKYDELRAAGKPVDNFVSMYNSSKLVVAIDKEMIVPVYVQYSAYRHFSIKKQYDLANDSDVSPMVQHLAAKELYAMTKMPEDKSIELKIGASDAVLAQQQELNDNIAMLVANQAAAFRRGEETSVLQRIHVNVSDAEVVAVALSDGDNDAD
jgi:hypothetical protein